MMRLIRQKLSVMSVFAVTLMLLITIPFQPIFAAMVSTDAALDVMRVNESRENLKKLISREDVQKMLIYRGIDPAEAKARVNSLTDSEAIVLAEEIDKLPAAGNAIGVIVGAALIVFLVLLLTDILGYTDVFPFVKAKK
ncbi:MAG: PA2779 family protein [Desulfobacterales bacterium]|jgi:cytochrome c-type biogenesis protein CcmH/NrfG